MISLEAILPVNPLWGLAVVLLGLFVFLVPRRPRGVPPGPTSWLPIVGNFLDTSDEDQRVWLRRLRRKYGDIYSFCIGSKLIIVISGYDAMKEAFVKQGEVFADRPKMFLTDTFDEGHGIACTSGQMWVEQRKFAVANLRKLGLGKSSMEGKIQLEVSDFLNILELNVSQPYDMTMDLQISVANCLMAVLFGTRFEHSDQKIHKLMQVLNANFHYLGSAGISNFFPSLRYLPGDIFKINIVLQNRDFMFAHMKEIIADHKKNFDETDINDYTGAFLLEMKKNGQTEDTSFTEKQLWTAMNDLFSGAVDTTTGTLRWITLHLINYPECQTKILEEIDRHIGRDRLPALEDRKMLVYTEAFIMETMRICEVSINSVPHAPTRETIFRGYRIPADSVIIPDLDSVLSDPELWIDPDVFRPERFISPENTLVKPEYYIPFSLGRRICIGDQMARMEMFLFVTSMVQKFSFSAPDGEDLSLKTLDGIFGLTHFPKPYKILVSPRT